MMHLYTLEDPYNVYEVMSEESYVNPYYADAVKTRDVRKRAHRLYKPDQNYKFLEKTCSCNGAKPCHWGQVSPLYQTEYRQTGI